MRRVTLWDRVEAGRPVLDEDHPRVVDEGLKSSLLSYLRSGTPIVVARGKWPDYLSDNDRGILPMVYYTDGEWIWTEQHIYYLERYDVLPEHAFVASVRERTEAPSVDEDVQQRAIQLIQG